MALSVAEVRAALDDGDEAIRHAAVARLDLAEQGAVGLLVRAMGDESWRVRREAVERAVAGTLDRATLLAALAPLLGDPENVGLRNAAIEAVVALGGIAAPRLERELIDLPAHRKILCDVLGRIAEPSSAGSLVRCLGDVDANVQIAAAEALGRLGPGVDEEVARALLSRLGELVRELGAGASPGRELLGSALLDAMSRRRVALPFGLLEPLLGSDILGPAALRAFGSAAIPREPEEQTRAKGVIVAQLDSVSRVRREAGLLAVARLLRAELVPTVTLSVAAVAAATEALLEGTVEVQRAAALVLGASGKVEAVRSLLVAGEDAALADSVEQALSMLACREPGALGGAVRSLSERARALVYRVLNGRLALPADGGGALVAALSADLVAEDAELAVAASAALGALGDASCAEALALALEQSYAARAELEEPWARIEALQQALQALAARARNEVLGIVRARAHHAPFLLVLGRVGDVIDATSLSARLGDPDASARRRGAEALAALTARTEVDLDVAQLERIAGAARDSLADEIVEVRGAAVGLLLAVEARRAVGATQASVEALLRAARDGEARVRGAAARALVELAASASGEVASLLRGGMRSLVDAPDSLAGVPLLEALLALHDDLDDARVLDALTGHDEERRKVALQGLATRPRLLRREELLGLVECALHHERWDLRRAAVAALAAAGDRGRAALLARRAVETDPLVCGDLERALGTGSVRRG